MFKCSNVQRTKIKMAIATALVLSASSVFATDHYTITNLDSNKSNLTPRYISDDGDILGSADFGDAKGQAVWRKPNGKIKNLGTLGGETAQAVSAGQHGQFVGSTRTISGNIHAFYYSAEVGNLLDLGTLGGKNSAATGINRDGMIVGFSEDTEQRNRAFVYTEQWGMLDIGDLGGDNVYAYDVNDHGQIVGYAEDENKRHLAFVFDNNQLSSLGTLGGTLSRAYAINNAGQIVGMSQTIETAYHAFLFQNGQMQDLGSLGGNYSVAYGINEQGQVVGESKADTGKPEAFIVDGGKMVALSSYLPAGSQWHLSKATAINDKGQIIGVGLFHGVRSAFLMEPAAEELPSTPQDSALEQTDEPLAQ